MLYRISISDFLLHDIFFFIIDTKGKFQRINLIGGDRVSNTNSSGTNKSLTLLWGATGEQEWTPALTTGLPINIPNISMHKFYIK